MTELANIHAITSHLNKLKTTKNFNHFLLITKEIIRVQSSDKNIRVLNTSNANFVNEITGTMGTNINNLYFNASDINMLNISNLFNNDYKLFKFVSQLMNKQTLIKKISRQINNLVNNNDSLARLIKTFNYIILFKIMHTTLSKKTIENVHEFKLLDQLNEITATSETIFKLYLLRNNDITIFLNSINYDSFSMNLNEIEQEQICEILTLFR
jgi:hypothetical protein